MSTNGLLPAVRSVVIAIIVVMTAGMVLGLVVQALPLGVDASITRDLSRFTRHHHQFEQVMRGLTAAGSTAFLVSVVLIVTSVLVLRHARASAVVVVTGTAVGAAMVTGLKLGVGRPRPPTAVALVHATGESFPSGHAMNSTIVYGLLLVLLARSKSHAQRAAFAGGAALLVAGSQPPGWPSASTISATCSPVSSWVCCGWHF